MSLGLFDVVGPIMHGPSSNHTGGMTSRKFRRRGILAQKLSNFFRRRTIIKYRGRPGFRQGPFLYTEWYR